MSHQQKVTALYCCLSQDDSLDGESHSIQNHNHIFRSFPIVDELQIEQSRIESVTAEISDQKLLEAMVRLCMNPLENRSMQEKNALLKIKYFIYQAGLL